MTPRTACGHWRCSLLQALACAVVAAIVMLWIWQCMLAALNGRER